MRYLGVDPGGRRMGFAAGDDVTGVVSPLEVAPFRNTKDAVCLILELARKINAACIVVGLPIGVDGTRGPACLRSEKLAAELTAQGIEVALQGEYLSTDDARRRARSVGRPARSPVDDIAAQILLEEYLAIRAKTAAEEA
ncbi:MAG: Holliday junction resolvase RuvX [Acidobacteriota bacterium]